MNQITPYRCYICQEPANMRCGKCKEIRYCKVDCQKKHWPAHAIACKAAETFIRFRTIKDKEGNYKDFDKGLVSFFSAEEIGAEQDKTKLVGSGSLESILDLRVPGKDTLRSLLSTQINKGSLKALDLGTGNGISAFNMRELGFDVTAVDILPAAKCFYGTDIEFRQGDMMGEEILADENKYGFINCIHALGYCDPAKIEMFFQKVYRALEPGGVFVCSVFFDEDPNIEKNSISWSLNKLEDIHTTENSFRSLKFDLHAIMKKKDSDWLAFILKKPVG